jgi:hypothetical protein
MPPKPLIFKPTALRSRAAACGCARSTCPTASVWNPAQRRGGQRGAGLPAAMTATRDREHTTHSVAASRAGRPPDAPGACIAAAAMAITSTSARIAHSLSTPLAPASSLTNSTLMVDVPTQHAVQQVARAGLRHCRISAPTLTYGNARDTPRVLLRHRTRAPYHPTPAPRRSNARSGNRASRRSWSSCERCTSSGSILPCATRQVGRVARAVARRCPSRKYYVL